jgi:hypothetical protein
MRVPENDVEQLLMAGERLVAALAAEERLARLRTTDPSDRSIFERWMSKRSVVETLRQQYFSLIDEGREIPAAAEQLRSRG